MNRFQFLSRLTTTPIIRKNVLSDKPSLRSADGLVKEYETNLHHNVSNSVHYPTPFYLTAGGRHNPHTLRRVYN